MITGAVLAIGSSLILIVTQAPVLIGVSRVLQGVAFTLTLPAAYALLPTLVPGRRLGAATGAFGAIPNISLALGPPIGLNLLQLSPTALFAGAVVAASVAFLAALTLPAPKPDTEEEHHRVRLDRRWLPLLAVTFLTVVYWGVVTAYLPLHTPPEMVGSVGWFFTADALGVMALRIPAGYLTDRHGPRWLMVGGIVVTALAVGLLLLPPTTSLLVLAGIGTGAGAALLLPPILVELSATSTTRNRGMAMTLFTGSFAAAIIVGSLGGGPVVSHLGFGAAVALSIALCLAALPIAALSAATRVPSEASVDRFTRG
jgi:MFS family permease